MNQYKNECKIENLARKLELHALKQNNIRFFFRQLISHIFATMRCRITEPVVQLLFTHAKTEMDFAVATVLHMANHFIFLLLLSNLLFLFPFFQNVQK